MIAVSLNVGGGVRLITDARLRVCAAMVPYRAEPLGERRYKNWNTHNAHILLADRTLKLSSQMVVFEKFCSFLLFFHHYLPAGT